jgi:hypothetical protein
VSRKEPDDRRGRRCNLPARRRRATLAHLPVSGLNSYRGHLTKLGSQRFGLASLSGGRYFHQCSMGDRSMPRRFSGSVGALVLGLSLTAVPWARAQQPVAMKLPAPELQGIDEWVNGKPTSLKDLKGKVVVLHFWAFG